LSRRRAANAPLRGGTRVRVPVPAGLRVAAYRGWCI